MSCAVVKSLCHYGRVASGWDGCVCVGRLVATLFSASSFVVFLSFSCLATSSLVLWARHSTFSTVYSSANCMSFIDLHSVVSLPCAAFRTAFTRWHVASGET